ncbi:MAG: PPOX class F420-dependent oxidoreductase [Dermatophilaceae bacterium]
MTRRTVREARAPQVGARASAIRWTLPLRPVRDPGKFERVPRAIATTTTVDLDAMSDDFDGARVLVDDTAAVLVADVEPFVEYLRTISGEHPDWNEYRRAMVDQGASLLRITPTRWGPVDVGGFPPRLADT